MFISSNSDHDGDGDGDSDVENQLENVCPICLEDLNDMKETIKLTCSHIICNMCVINMIKHKEFKSCPLCRNPISFQFKFDTAEKLIKNIENYEKKITIMEHIMMDNYIDEIRNSEANILREIINNDRHDDVNEEQNREEQNREEQHRQEQNQYYDPEDRTITQEICELCCSSRECIGQLLFGLLFCMFLYAIFL